MSDTYPEPLQPFMARTYRRDVLSDLASAPLQDVEAAISRLLGSAAVSPDPKKDGKDGAADGILGLAAGRLLGEETGKESTDDTGKESTDDTGKESTDDTGKESTDDTGKESTDDTGKESTDDTGKESTDTTGKEATDKPGKDSTLDDLIHWYINTFSVKGNKDVLDDDPKGLRDTAMEMPSDFDISSFNVGNVHGSSLNRAGPTANLDDEKLRLIQETHTALLDDLLRPDQPII